MSGPVVLHGGGEYEAGDDACVSAVLALGAARAGGGAGRGGGPVRVVVVPTATARWSPERSAAHGVAAFRRVGQKDRLEVAAESALIVDEASAADVGFVALLAAADIVAFPGGDPDLIASVMRGSPAWAAIVGAHEAGAVLTGASAGAMALAPWTWTPSGGVDGLGVIPGLVVVPHADTGSWEATIERFAAMAPPRLGFLGLAERTAAVTSDPTRDPVRWQVVGEGEVRWLRVRDGTTAIFRRGDWFETPGRRAS